MKLNILVTSISIPNSKVLTIVAYRKSLFVALSMLKSAFNIPMNVRTNIATKNSVLLNILDIIDAIMNTSIVPARPKANFIY